jgi:hypothetical protein
MEALAVAEAARSQVMVQADENRFLQMIAEPFDDVWRIVEYDNDV